MNSRRSWAGPLRIICDMAAGRVALPFAPPVDIGSLRRSDNLRLRHGVLRGAYRQILVRALARLPVDVEIASEFRYRDPPLEAEGLTLLISQSGETADTLASLRAAKAKGQKIMAVVNETTSTIARESDVVAPTLAGPEIGVASTKAFTCQLAVLACLALAFGRARNAIERERGGKTCRRTHGNPRVDRASAEMRKRGRSAGARNRQDARRALSRPWHVLSLALEGALKLKEISYIHAEGYAAGELKHGPIALIDQDMTVIVIAPNDGVLEKTISNMQEVAARGGRLILIGDSRLARDFASEAAATIVMRDVAPEFAAMVYAVPIQLIAYHTAVAMGKDADQPRNLAKSVTVE